MSNRQGQHAAYQASVGQQAALVQQIQVQAGQTANAMLRLKAPFTKVHERRETRMIQRERMLFGVFPTTDIVPQQYRVVDGGWWLLDELQTYFEYKELIRYNAGAPYIERTEEEFERVYLSSTGVLWLEYDKPVLLMKPGGKYERFGKGSSFHPCPDDKLNILDGERARRRERTQTTSSDWGPYRIVTRNESRDSLRPAVQQWGEGLSNALSRLLQQQTGRPSHS